MTKDAASEISETRPMSSSFGDQSRAQATPGIARGGRDFARTMAALFSGGFSTFALLYSAQPLLPVFAREFALSPAASSLALSATTATLAFSLLIAGTISDVLGRKRVMVASLAASSAIMILAAFAQNWGQLVVLRALTGIALSGLPAVAMAYLADEMAANAMGLAMGLYIAGNTVGGLAGRLVGAVAADYGTWRGGLLLVGAVGLLSVVLFARALPPSRAFSPVRPNLRLLFRSLIDHFADPGLRLLFLIGFLLMGCFVTVYNYIGFRLLEPPFSLSQTEVGLIFLLYLFGGVSSAAMGDLAGRIGRRRVLWIGMAMMLFGLATTLADRLVFIIAGVGLITIGFFGAHSIASSWVGLRAEKAKAQAASLYLLFYYLGSSVVGTIGGVFYARDEWPGVAALVGALMAAGLIVALMLARVPPPKWMAKH
jgi:MFS transporter, YNFM family, putative membrane transport protein